MRIAMIGQKGMPAHYGGVEKHVHDLSVHLVSHGHDVTVYSRTWYAPHSQKNIDGVSIVYTPSIHTKHLDAITHTLTSTLHALTQQYDVIHYHGVGPALLSWLPRLLTPKTKVVVTFHSIDRYHQKWNWFARLILRLGEFAACRCAHETISVSQSLYQYCLNEFNAHTAYIPNAVNMHTRPVSDHYISQFGLAKNKYLVMVSRLVPHKGAHILIEAFNNLKKHHPGDSVIQELKLAIVGGSTYTDEYVRQLHLQASLLNDVIFTDFQSGEALEQLYAHARALVHPSLNEGLPITVIQAMSYSMPVIVSTIPEHLELVHDSRVLFKENDVDSLEQELYQFLNLSEDERKHIGDANRRVVEKGYSWENILPQIVDVYEKGNTKQQKRKEMKEAIA